MFQHRTLGRTLDQNPMVLYNTKGRRAWGLGSPRRSLLVASSLPCPAAWLTISKPNASSHSAPRPPSSSSLKCGGNSDAPKILDATPLPRQRKKNRGHSEKPLANAGGLRTAVAWPASPSRDGSVRRRLEVRVGAPQSRSRLAWRWHPARRGSLDTESSVQKGSRARSLQQCNEAG